MLDGLRGFAKSWPGKIMGAFLLVGVAGFGINNVILDLGSNTVGRVGDEEISGKDFFRTYQQQLNQLTQTMGTMPTTSQASAMGVPSSVLMRLANEAAIDSLSNSFGLGVTEAKLAQLLREDPSFFGTLGNFDPQVFRAVLQNSGMTEAEYFDSATSMAQREQLTQAMFVHTKLPSVAADLINSYANTTRAIDYFALTDANIETPAEPTEEELKAYLAEHQNEYRTIETRKVRLFDLSIPALAATIDVPEADIAAEYEATSANLTTPEQRTIQQLVLNTPELQTAFAEGLASGATFEDLVAQAGVTPTTLGTLPRSAINDARLGDAAFALNAGEFAIIPGIGGERAVFASEIIAEARPTLEEASEQIKTRLAQAKARTEVNEILDQVEELRAAFQPLDQIAERFNLPVYEVDLTASGAELSVLPNLANDDRNRVSQAIFAAQMDKLTPAIPVTGNAHVWFDLLNIAPVRDETFEEVREEITAAITQERVEAAMTALGEDIVARLDAGETLSDIAMSLSTFPQISSPFTRFGSEDGTIDQVTAAAVFAGGAEHRGTVINQNGEFIVFEVMDSSTPAEPLQAEIVDNLNGEVQNDLFGDFISAVRDDAGVRVNEQAMTNIITQNFGQ
ncbi:SurA N-terminal domain-containing protein [Devosia sp. WQ 349]|uniref:peptidylprolyl isomerase n=1 Tax=Devosia sp. WQ 349K1 TaxID=2800329 RepID=UPI0019073437|nr:peptidylprolyl isomerase [Devosia sp. WQ 349K1]MBK1793093.1 SurA N-terminal domain-containing protein [Devosia sp. WQ 349K1]